MHLCMYIFINVYVCVYICVVFAHLCEGEEFDLRSLLLLPSILVLGTESPMEPGGHCFV